LRGRRTLFPEMNLAIDDQHPASPFDPEIFGWPRIRRSPKSVSRTGTADKPQRARFRHARAGLKLQGASELLTQHRQEGAEAADDRRERRAKTGSGWDRVMGSAIQRAAKSGRRRWHHRLASNMCEADHASADFRRDARCGVRGALRVVPSVAASALTAATAAAARLAARRDSGPRSRPYT